MQIAIDGPAGSGKTSVARALAKHFGFLLVNTGAMYRAMALGLHQGLTIAETQITVRPDERIWLNGKDVTGEIYTREMDMIASQMAARSDVRALLVSEQQRLACGHDVVMEGRDIGTVVLPHADVKIYLDASVEERARRRCQEREDQESYGTVLAEIRERDAHDGCGFGRLQLSSDTFIIHTDGRSLRDVCKQCLEIVGRALQRRAASDKLS